MYIVKIDGNFLFGTGKYERPGYEIISPVADLAVNTAGTFTFTIYSEHPRYDDVDNTKSIVTVEKDGEEEPVFRGRVLSAELGFYNEKKVICEGELAFLCDSIQYPYNFTADSARQTISKLLGFFLRRHNEKTGMDDTRKFLLGEVTVTDGDTSNTDNLISAADSTYSNTYDSIKKKLIERYGGYLYVRHTDTGNYIDYLSTPPETCSQKIEFGENLLDIRKNIDADSLVTAVIPLGKELTNTTTDQTYRLSIEGHDAENYIKDDDIVQVKDATGTFTKYYSCLYSKSGVEKYGWIEKTLIFDDVVTPTTLAKYGAAYLKSMGKSQSIELTAADLSGTNTEIDRFRLAQYVRVNSKPHGLENELYVVSKLSLNLVNPAENKLCLGSETATLTGQISGGGSYSSSASSINVGGGGAGYDPAGSASAALQEAKEYADDKDAETLSSARSYTDTATAEKLDKSTKYAGSDIAGGDANSAKKLTSDAGDENNPVYFKNGVPVKCGHSVKSDVPENAVFSDTKDTAGVTRFPSSQQKLYLIGCPTDLLGNTLSYGSTYTYADSYVLNGNLYINGKKIAYDEDKVNKVEGKGLSTNDYTTTEKTKLSGIAEGANKTVVDSDLSTTSTNPVQNKVIASKINATDSAVGSMANSLNVAFNRLDSIEDNYLPLRGGTVTGTTTFSHAEYAKQLKVNRASTTSGVISGIDYLVNNSRVGVLGFKDTSELYVRCGTSTNNVLTVDSSGNGTFAGNVSASKLNSSLDTSTFLLGNQGKAIINSTNGGTGYTMLAKMNSTNGVFTHGSYQTKYLLNYTANSTISAGTNAVTKSVTLLDESGNSSFPGTVTASAFSGNASSATKWATARNINGLSVDGTANRVNYGTCSTAAATAAKVVACTGFALVTGAEITVKFTVTNTASSPTLNVNSTGAKAIYYRGSAILAGYLVANHTYTFRYNGTQYELVGDVNTNNYVTQTNTTAGYDYRLLLSNGPNDNNDTNIARKSTNFYANPSTGVLTSKYFNATSGGKLLASSDCDGANSTFTITIADLTKYSHLLIRFWSIGLPSASQYAFSEIIPVQYLVKNPNTYIAVGSVLKSVTGSTSGLFDNSGIEIAYTSGNNLALKTSSYCSGVGYDIYSL